MASMQLDKPNEEASLKAADGAGSQCCEVSNASSVKEKVIDDQTNDAQESKHGQLIKHGQESVLTQHAKVGVAANENKKKEKKEKKEEKKKAASSTKPAAKASHKIKEEKREKKEKKKTKHKDGSSSSESESDGHENKKKLEGKKLK